MNEFIVNDCELLTPEMFNSALEYLAKKNCLIYKFILRGGQSLLNALFKLFFAVWKSEYIPRVWHHSSLVQLEKSKSKVTNSLANFRFIHCKSETAKFFGQIIISKAKSTIFENMSKYQIATKPGHRASEH